MHPDNFVSILSKKYVYMSDKQKDSKKIAILKAAQEEFVAKGYDGARTMEIAEKAGIGQSLLHYHFKTKKELFKCVVQQKMDLLRQAILVSWTDSDNGLLEKLSEIIGKHFDFVMENADYLRFQFQEMERHPELFEEIKTAVQAGLRKLSSALQEELDRAVDLAAKFTDKIIIEKMVQNLQEINCSVYGSYHDCHASVLEEPLRSGDILSYQDKYMGGGATKGGSKGMKMGGKFGGAKSAGSKGMSGSQRKCPADLPEDVTKKIQALAIKTFKEMNASGIIRIDFMRDSVNGDIYVNEINAIPGSLSFYLWEATGKKFVDVLDEIINIAVKESEAKHKMLSSFDQNIFAMGGGFTAGAKGAKR